MLADSGGIVQADNETLLTDVRARVDDAIEASDLILFVLEYDRMTEFDEFIVKKRHIGRLYNEYLKGTDKITLQPASCSYAENIYWVYGIVLKKESGMNAAEAMKRKSE